MTANDAPETNPPAPPVEEIDFSAAPPEEHLQYPYGLKVEDRPPEPVVEPPKPINKNLILYGSIAAIAGIFLAILWATGILNIPGVASLASMTRPPSTVNDLGAAPFSAAGLVGHLVLQPGDKLQYKLRIDPSSVQQLDGFSATVGAQPQPLEVNFVLKDASGFALCGKQVLLPYGDEQPPPPSQAKPGSKAAQQEAAAAEARALEQDREKGHDLFENEENSEGQITAINAQGVLDCSADAYKKIDYWDFTTNFPPVATQLEILSHPGRSAHLLHSSGSEPSKPAPGFYIEGDDIIRGYDLNRGLVQTTSSKTYLIDSKKGKLPDLTGWAVSGAPIHYRCDSNGYCTLSRSGSGISVHAHLNK
jgi:hypothetical protein